MDICGEHGDEIAYAGRDCPACAQIEDLNKEHNMIVEDLENQVNEDDEKIGDLQAELDAISKG